MFSTWAYSIILIAVDGEKLQFVPTIISNFIMASMHNVYTFPCEIVPTLKL